MVRSVREVARYTERDVRYNVLISGKLQYLDNSLVPEVIGIDTFTVHTVNCLM
jgi:hypothetical protein